MKLLNNTQRKFVCIIAIIVLSSIVLASCGPQRITNQAKPRPTAGRNPTPIATGVPIDRVPSTPTPTPIVLPNVPTLGIDGTPPNGYPGIPWLRLSYPSCGAAGNVSGSALKNRILHYHLLGIHILLIVCQVQDGPALFQTKWLNDAAQGGADAVQCGNEEMKINTFTTYIPPADFARFYDLCQRAVHAVRPDVPVLVGSLDPHVGGIDYQPLVDQANYLNSMQYAMNTQVHPGGNWNWHSQIVGLIDSWHNGYPNASVNSLYGLFSFWAQQFQVDLNSGGLGKHIWVIEGTGCFQGCGLDPYNSYEIAVSHILTLITDVQTAMRYHVPFFYFSDKDFPDEGTFWPIGILDANGHSKPLRQDLPMGARTLTLSCSGNQATVADQEQLLAKLYAGCTLPGNYISILTS